MYFNDFFTKNYYSPYFVDVEGQPPTPVEGGPYFNDYFNQYFSLNKAINITPVPPSYNYILELSIEPRFNTTNTGEYIQKKVNATQSVGITTLFDIEDIDPILVVINQNQTRYTFEATTENLYIIPTEILQPGFVTFYFLEENNNSISTIYNMSVSPIY